MVTEITNKVQTSRRDISIKQKQELPDTGQIIVVSTYEADNNMIEAVKDSEEIFKQTQSFRNQRGSLFKYVKKVGPNIKSKVNTLKHQALGIKRGSATKCNGRGCKTCKMIMTTPFAMIRGKKVILSQGSCKTYNTCYLGQCTICKKPYVGRTVEEIHKRVCGHRRKYKEILKRAEERTLEEVDTSSDQYMLGLHLYLEHGLSDPDAFDKHMKFGILDVVSPQEIEKKEFTWMHRLNTFQPVGINIEYPFGIPLLGQH